MSWLLMLGLSTQAQANPRYAAIVIDAATGEVLHSANADATRYPASLTKMMTLYLAFEAIEEGRLTLDQELLVSAHAASMPASKLGLRAGERIALRDAISALIIRSANDVAVVVAEALAGTEYEFGQIMTRRAREMGMHNTTFRNASGLPDDLQTSTARDLAILSLHLMNDFPQYYHYFANSSFTWRGQTINGHNRLLTNYVGADGLKTGFIRASGFNVATSAVRDGRRIVAVVMGGFTAQSRDDHMMALLDRGFMRASLQDNNDWVAQTHISPQSLATLNGSSTGGTEPTLAVTDVQTTPAPAEPDPIRLHLALDAQVASEGMDSANGTEASSVPASAASDPILALLTSPPQTAEGDGGNWSVQIGAFRDAELARSRADQAAGYLVETSARVAVTEVEASDRKMFRARLVDLQETQARNVCDRLQQQGIDCLVVR